MLDKFKSQLSAWLSLLIGLIIIGIGVTLSLSSGEYDAFARYDLSENLSFTLSAQMQLALAGSCFVVIILLFGKKQKES